MGISHADIKKTEDIVVDLLHGMKLKLHPEVSADVDGIKVNLIGKDSAIIIGYHGETLADFTYILGIILRREISDNFILRVDSGDYMKNKDNRIKDIALRAVETVKKTGFPERISGLNSYERRLVHSVVDQEGLISESTGIGKERVIVVKQSLGE